MAVFKDQYILEYSSQGDDKIAAAEKAFKAAGEQVASFTRVIDRFNDKGKIIGATIEAISQDNKKLVTQVSLSKDTWSAFGTTVSQTATQFASVKDRVNAAAQAFANLADIQRTTAKGAFYQLTSKLVLPDTATAQQQAELQKYVTALSNIRTQARLSSEELKLVDVAIKSLAQGDRKIFADLNLPSKKFAETLLKATQYVDTFNANANKTQAATARLALAYESANTRTNALITSSNNLDRAVLAFRNSINKTIGTVTLSNNENQKLAASLIKVEEAVIRSGISATEFKNVVKNVDTQNIAAIPPQFNRVAEAIIKARTQAEKFQQTASRVQEYSSATVTATAALAKTLSTPVATSGEFQALAKNIQAVGEVARKENVPIAEFNKLLNEATQGKTISAGTGFEKTAAALNKIVGAYQKLRNQDIPTTLSAAPTAATQFANQLLQAAQAANLTAEQNVKLIASLSQVQQQFTRAGITGSEFSQIVATLSNNGGNITALGTGLQGVGRAVVNATNLFDKFSKQVAEAAKIKLDQTANVNSLNNLAVPLTTLPAGVAATSKAAVDLDNALRRVREAAATSKISVAEFNKIIAEFQATGLLPTTRNARELSIALAGLAQAQRAANAEGIKATSTTSIQQAKADIEAYVTALTSAKNVTQISAAEQNRLTLAISAMSNIVGATGQSFAQLEKIVQTNNRAANLGNTSFRELKTAYDNLVAAANNLGDAADKSARKLAQTRNIEAAKTALLNLKDAEISAARSAGVSEANIRQLDQAYARVTRTIVAVAREGKTFQDVLNALGNTNLTTLPNSLREAVVALRSANSLSVELVNNLSGSVVSSTNLATAMQALNQAFPNLEKVGVGTAQEARIKNIQNALQQLLVSGKISVQQFENTLKNFNQGITSSTDRATNDMIRLLNRLKSEYQGLERAGTKSVLAQIAGFERLGAILVSTVFRRSISFLTSEFQRAEQQAIDFSIAIARIQTIQGQTNLTGKDWINTIRSISDEFGTGLLDVAAAAYGTLSNQIGNAAESSRFLFEAQRFGRIAVASTTDSINLLASVLNSYGLNASETDRISGQLFKTIELGRITASEMANTFGRVAGLARFVGVSLEELSAAISLLTISGLRYNEAFTLISNLTLKLAKPSENLSKFLREQGFETGRAAVETLGFVGVLRLLAKASESANLDLAGTLREIRAIRGAVGLAGNKKTIARFEENIKEIAQGYSELDKAEEFFFKSSGQRLKESLQQISNFFSVDIANRILTRIDRLTSTTGERSENILGKSFINISNYIIDTVEDYVGGISKLVGGAFDSIAAIGSGTAKLLNLSSFNQSIEGSTSGLQKLTRETRGFNSIWGETGKVIANAGASFVLVSGSVAAFTTLINLQTGAWRKWNLAAAAAITALITISNATDVAGQSTRAYQRILQETIKEEDEFARQATRNSVKIARIQQDAVRNLARSQTQALGSYLRGANLILAKQKALTEEQAGNVTEIIRKGTQDRLKEIAADRRAIIEELKKTERSISEVDSRINSFEFQQRNQEFDFKIRLLEDSNTTKILDQERELAEELNKIRASSFRNFGKVRSEEEKEREAELERELGEVRRRKEILENTISLTNKEIEALYSEGRDQLFAGNIDAAKEYASRIDELVRRVSDASLELGTAFRPNTKFADFNKQILEDERQILVDRAEALKGEALSYQLISDEANRIKAEISDISLTGLSSSQLETNINLLQAKLEELDNIRSFENQSRLLTQFAESIRVEAPGAIDLLDLAEARIASLTDKIDQATSSITKLKGGYSILFADGRLLEEQQTLTTEFKLENELDPDVIPLVERFASDLESLRNTGALFDQLIPDDVLNKMQQLGINTDSAGASIEKLTTLTTKFQEQFNESLTEVAGKSSQLIADFDAIEASLKKANATFRATSNTLTDSLDFEAAGGLPGAIIGPLVKGPGQIFESDLKIKQLDSKSKNIPQLSPEDYRINFDSVLKSIFGDQDAENLSTKLKAAANSLTKITNQRIDLLNEESINSSIQQLQDIQSTIDKLSIPDTILEKVPISDLKKGINDAIDAFDILLEKQKEQAENDANLKRLTEEQATLDEILKQVEERNLLNKDSISDVEAYLSISNSIEDAIENQVKLIKTFNDDLGTSVTTATQLRDIFNGIAKPKVTAPAQPESSPKSQNQQSTVNVGKVEVNANTNANPTEIAEEVRKTLNRFANRR